MPSTELQSDFQPIGFFYTENQNISSEKFHLKKLRNLFERVKSINRRTKSKSEKYRDQHDNNLCNLVI